MGNLKVRRVVMLDQETDERLLMEQHNRRKKNRRFVSLNEIIKGYISAGLKGETWTKKTINQ